MRFRATLSFEYEVSDDTALQNYGTLDPDECAKIDQEGLEDDPGMFLHMSESVDTKVEVVE